MLDVCFLLQAPFTDHDLHTKVLLEEPLVIILPPDADGTRTLESFTLKDNENILFIEKGSYRDYFEAFLRSRGIATESGMEFWSIGAIKQCVMCGLGISMLPYVTVQSDLNQNKFQSIPWEVFP